MERGIRRLHAEAPPTGGDGEDARGERRGDELRERAQVAVAMAIAREGEAAEHGAGVESGQKERDRRGNPATIDGVEERPIRREGQEVRARRREHERPVEQDHGGVAAPARLVRRAHEPGEQSAEREADERGEGSGHRDARAIIAQRAAARRARSGPSWAPLAASLAEPLRRGPRRPGATGGAAPSGPLPPSRAVQRLVCRESDEGAKKDRGLREPPRRSATKTRRRNDAAPPSPAEPLRPRSGRPAAERRKARRRGERRPLATIAPPR